jgi:cadmium resistance protein CadD (predicted permease)
MESLLSTVGLGIVVFASTNVDDAFVLVAFFADKSFLARDVVIGQYAGVGMLYMVSAIASLISLIVPPPYVGLLGLVPIAIGTKKLRRLKQDRKDEKLHDVSAPTLHVRTLGVAAVTMANGGDNIAVWAALFASRGGCFEVATFGIVFAIMTGLWCFAAHWLVNHRAFGAPIRDRAQQVVPFVLIGLGVMILIRSGALQLWK